MKKIFLFLTAAALMAVACNKSETVVRNLAPDEIGFRALSGNITKGAELNGVVLPESYGIYAAATQKNASGLIENASFFNSVEQLFATTDAPSTAASLWKADPAVFWPVGGVRMDFLAYAIKKADHADASAPGVWHADWDYATTDVARQVSFKEVDTYANQEDVLYAVANDQTSAANGGTGKSVAMEFNHAQALLIFNVKASTADQISIDEISFVTPERVEALRTYQNAVAAYDNAEHAAWQAVKDAHDAWVDNNAAYQAYQQYLTQKGAWEGEQSAAYAAINADDVQYPTDGDKAAAKSAWDTANPAPTPVAEANDPGPEPAEPGPEPSGAPVLADLTDDDVTLKTIGTFTVNNERNILAADWSFGDNATKAANYKMKDGSVRSTANSGEGDGCIAYGTKIGATATQLGETLLIPQQPKLNFTIKYTANGNTLYYTVNEFRGLWEKGHKYIYNIDLTINEIVITEEVADFVANQSPVTL